MINYANNSMNSDRGKLRRFATQLSPAGYAERYVSKKTSLGIEMNIIGTIAMLAVLSLSSTNLIAGDNEVENIEPNIIGKTFFFDYGSYAYDIAITSNKSLHWNLVKGSFEGPDQGDNPYLSSKIDDGIVFISWEEESGMQFYNLMNLNTGILTTHANAGGMSVNMGTVSIKK